MKIRRIELIDFQSHEHTRLDLTDGVNVLVGMSNVGKSSVLRAILWVLTNRPSGTGMIRKGAKEARVIIETDSFTVERVRGPKLNGYLLAQGGVGTQYNVIGKDVPEPVMQALNMSGLNVHAQFDPFFLLLAFDAIAYSGPLPQWPRMALARA